MIPKYVKLNNSALRLWEDYYIRDSGRWYVEHICTNGELRSWKPKHPEIHNVKLIPISAKKWAEDNGLECRLFTVLEKYDERSRENGTERSLYLLLERYKMKLPPLDSQFHKMFRQTDVINPTIDMVIWNLLNEVQGFWICAEDAK